METLREIAEGSTPWRVQLVYTGTSGDFTITVNGEPTAALGFGASAARVREEIEALPSVIPGDVTVALRREPITIPNTTTNATWDTYILTFQVNLKHTEMTVSVASSGADHIVDAAESYVTYEVTAAEIELFDTDAERQAIASDLESAILARFAPVSGAVEGWTASSPPSADAISMHWLINTDAPNDGGYGTSAPEAPLSGDGVDGWDEQVDVLNLRNDYNILINNLRLSRATNPSSITDVATFVDTFLEDTVNLHGDMNVEQLITGLSYTAAHESGHTLGLPHAAQAYTGSLPLPATVNHQVMEVVRNGVQGRTDIMFGGYKNYDDASANQFRAELTLELLKMALGAGWNQDEGEAAIAYLIEQQRIGAVVQITSNNQWDILGVDPEQETTLAPTNPGGHLAVMDGNGLLTGNALDFGSIVTDGAGGEFATTEFSFVNYGSDPLLIRDIFIEGDASFIGEGIAAGTSIAPGEARTYTLKFDPRSTGPHSATLRLRTNDPGAQTRFDLSGFASAAVGALGVSYDNNNLGGLQLQDLPVIVNDLATVTNDGATALTIYDIRPVGENKDEFFVTGLPAGFGFSQPIVLNPGGSFSFKVGFDAARIGIQQGDIQIFSTDPRATAHFTVIGTGLEDGIGAEAKLGNDYIAVATIDGTLLGRTRSDADGGWSMNVAGGTVFHVVTYDPDTGLVSHGFGIADDSGKLEEAPAIIFEASTDNDSDGNGLAGDIEFAMGSVAVATQEAARAVAGQWQAFFFTGGLQATRSAFGDASGVTSSAAVESVGSDLGEGAPAELSGDPRPVPVEPMAAGNTASGPAASTTTQDTEIPVGIVNGGFSVRDPNDPGFGWTVTGDVTVGNSPTVLREDPRSLTGLTQNFLLPENALALRFTILDADFEANQDGAPDAFEFALLGSDMQSLIDTVSLSHTDAAFNVQTDGTVFTSPRVRLLGLDPDGRIEENEIVIVEADLTGIAAGTELRVFFGLIGFGATTSEVWIDNVLIITEGQEVNDPPVAVDDSAEVAEDGSVDIPVLANDSDPEGDAISVSLVDSPVHGTAAINPDGTVAYSPAANFFGSDTFTYRVSDGQLTSSLARVAITITPVNDAPVAWNESYNTMQDTSLVVTAQEGVLANDTDVENDPLTAVLVDEPVHGALTLNSDGSFTYTPVAGFNGADSFTYRASDGLAESNIATVAVTLTVEANQPPVARVDAYSTDEDTPLTVAAAGVLANDEDPNGEPLEALLVSGPTHGILTLNADGSFTYTPNADFNGADGFTYQASDGALNSEAIAVSLTIRPVNDAPVLSAIGNRIVDEGSALSFAVTAADPKDDPANAVILKAEGLPDGAIFDPDAGLFTWTPGEAQQGSYHVTFTATDDGDPAQSDSETITITVNEVNEAPVLATIGNQYVNEGVSLAFAVSASDPDLPANMLSFLALDLPKGAVFDPDTRMFSWVPTEVQGPGIYDVTFRVSDGQATAEELVRITVYEVNTAPVLAAIGEQFINSRTFGWIPTESQGPGTYDVTFAVSDGEFTDEETVRILVAEVNVVPIARDDVYRVDEDDILAVPASGVLGNDADEDGNALSARLISGPSHGDLILNADGAFTYRPSSNFNGTDFFTYVANDGLADSSVATVMITVDPLNDAPMATDDEATTAEDAAVTIAVLANDTDVDGNPLSITSVTQGSHGAVVINPDNTVSYTPAPNFFGVDTFIYTASDGQGGSDSATVNVTVTPVNDGPIANDDSYVAREDTTLTVPVPGVLANDTDVEGDPLTAVLEAPPAHGGLSLDSNGGLTYTPSANFNGTDSFTYTANDGSSDSNTATVTITVTSVNDGPVANDDSATTPEDTGVTIAVLANDTDADGNTLIVASVTQGSNGTVVINPDGTVTYTPAANFNGSDSFTYMASDGFLNDAATVNVTVTSVNDAPVATDDTAATPEDAAVVIPVLANDSDVDGNPLSIASVTQGSHGAVAINPDNTVSYTPAPNFFGADTFSYTASDGFLSDTATVTITVNPSGPSTASLGDFVWHDLYHGPCHLVDGVQDNGEPGIAGVLVNLLDAGEAVVASTLTDASGFYEFSSVEAGTYFVEIASNNFQSGGALDGWYATFADRGTDEAKDSEGDLLTHRSESVLLAAGEVEFDIDFGFFTTGIDLTKTGPETVRVGETITYHFRLENTGDIVLHGGAQVYDALINPCGDHKIWSGILQPGQVIEFDRAYSTTMNDGIRGEVINTATAVGHPLRPDGVYLANVTDVDRWVVEVTQALKAAIDIEKYVMVVAEEGGKSGCSSGWTPADGFGIRLP